LLETLVLLVGNDLSNLPALKAAHNPALPQARFDKMLVQLGQ
jgi:hypothetical protein